MASNTTTTNNVCDMPVAFVTATSMITYISNTILPPIYFLLGGPAHLAALIAFLKPSKTEKAYGYQILVTGSKLAHIITYSWYVILFSNLATSDNAQWFRKSYALMWYTARVSYFFESIFMTIPTLISAAMAVDRAVAVMDPLGHQKIPHQRRQIWALVICSILGLFMSADIPFRWKVILIDADIIGDGDKTPIYKIVYDTLSVEYKTFAYQLNVIRNFLRLLALIVLVVASILMLRYFKSKNEYASKMLSLNAQQIRDRKISQKKLMLLALFQSVTIGVTTIGWCVFNTAYLLSPTFWSCQGAILFPILDGWMQLVNTVDLYVLFFANKRFKRMVLSAFLRHSNNSVVSTILVQPIN